jgi:hypothetical protein
MAKDKTPKSEKSAKAQERPADKPAKAPRAEAKPAEKAERAAGPSLAVAPARRAAA